MVEVDFLGRSWLWQFKELHSIWRPGLGHILGNHGSPHRRAIIGCHTQRAVNKYLLLINVMEFYGCSQPTRCIEVV